VINEIKHSGFPEYYDATNMSVEQVIENWAENNMKARERVYKVPIDQLWPYREYNWNRKNSREGELKVDNITTWVWGPIKWDAIKESMKKEGWKDGSWLTLYIGQEDGSAYLGEGNHRIVIAKELGMKEVLVVYGFRDGKVGKSISTPSQYESEPENVKLKDIIVALKNLSPQEFDELEDWYGDQKAIRRNDFISLMQKKGILK